MRHRDIKPDNMPVDVEADDFQPAPLRLVGERDDRIARGRDRLNYHNAYLDDCLRAILPNDLILVGAPSGIGKTDLVFSIAEANAALGKRVHVFALEAERAELERRRKYALLAAVIHKEHHELRADLNYTDWYMGDCEHIVGSLNDWADDQIVSRLGTLNTYYRGAKFDASALKKHFERIAPTTDLVILDHFHYIDTDDDDNENRAHGELAKLIRNLALVHGKPVIVVAHLRKRDTRARQICATLDDFHGSSNLVKNATQVIAIDRARSIKSKWWHSPTFLHVVKDRRAGETPLIAVVNFDLRLKRYENTYALGLLVKGGTEWSALKPGDAPHWAKQHRAFTSEDAPNQTEIEEQT